MTNPTGGEWKQYATFIFSEEGNICALSDPHESTYIDYGKLEINSPNWDEAMANGELIVKAVKAYRKILELFGPEWEVELKRLEEVSREI